MKSKKLNEDKGHEDNEDNKYNTLVYNNIQHLLP